MYWSKKTDSESESAVQTPAADDKRQEGLSGGFEPTDDDQRYSRESSKKKKKRNLNRTVQVLEQIPEHTVASSDPESLIGCNTTGGLVDGMMQCRTANVYKSP